MKSSDILLSTAHDLVETHICDSSLKDCILGNYPEGLKPGISLSDFEADVDLISFLQWQQVEKKLQKLINQCHSVMWFPNEWNNKQPKKAYIQKTWASCQLQ